MCATLRWPCDHYVGRWFPCSSLRVNACIHRYMLVIPLLSWWLYWLSSLFCLKFKYVLSKSNGLLWSSEPKTISLLWYIVPWRLLACTRAGVFTHSLANPINAGIILILPGRFFASYLRSWLESLSSKLTLKDKERIKKNKEDPKKAMVIRTISKRGSISVCYCCTKSSMLYYMYII